MKRILIVIAATLLCAASSRAQYVVYDPALHTQNIIDEAQNIAKYVQMIDNQVQQINTMTSQLQQLQQYNQAFGNPSQILNLAGFTGLISDLARHRRRSGRWPARKSRPRDRRPAIRRELRIPEQSFQVIRK